MLSSSVMHAASCPVCIKPSDRCSASEAALSGAICTTARVKPIRFMRSKSSGSAAPFEILLPVWISSACALAAGLTVALTGNALRHKKERKRAGLKKEKLAGYQEFKLQVKGG